MADELLAVVEQTGADIMSGHLEVEYQWPVVGQAVHKRATPDLISRKVRNDCASFTRRTAALL